MEPREAVRGVEATALAAEHDVLEVGHRAGEGAPELAAAHAEQLRRQRDRGEDQHALLGLVEILVAGQVHAARGTPTHASTARLRDRIRCPIAAPAAACARVITLGRLPPARGYHATRMFQSLSDKLQATLGDLRSRGALSAEDIDRAMREIRLALLEADVNFRVVKTFVAAVRERAVGQEVLTSLTPGQQVVKIVDEELTELLGAAGTKLTFAAKPPTVILLCGLQGSGKTTTAGKLASLLVKQGKKPALVAGDLQRPAAVEQLKTLGRQVDVPVFDRGTGGDPVAVARYGVEAATSQGRDVVIVDTAGRLHVDSDLMDELVRVRNATKPQNMLMVLDAMTGQDAVNVAEQFHDAVDFDGVDPDQARRRRPRRRGALGARGHRQADHVRLRRREARRSSRSSTPTAWPRASSAWATCSR